MTTGKLHEYGRLTIRAAGVCIALAAGCAFGAEFAHELTGDAKPWTSEKFLDDPQEFHFAIIGDLTGGERPGVYAKAVERLNMLRPEFVMSVGDLVAGGGADEESLRKQWASFRERTARLEMPFFYVVGNHDIWTGFTGMTPARQTSIDLWKEQFGPRTYYSFTYKGCLFVCLDSMERHDYYPPRDALSDALDALQSDDDVLHTVDIGVRHADDIVEILVLDLLLGLLPLLLVDRGFGVDLLVSCFGCCHLFKPP